MRVNVVLDLRKNLEKGRTINLQGEKMWIPFQYEKLPRICLNVGVLCMVERGLCKTKGVIGQYGPWMRVKMVGRGRSKEVRR